jgi:hypothetical protein
MKKILPLIIIIAVIAIGLSFYGGLRYGESKTSSGQFRNFTAGGGLGGGNGAGSGSGRARGNFISGSITAVSPSAMTIQLSDGSSRNINLVSNTPIVRSATGTVSDLLVGDMVSVSGSLNADNSFNAQSIQVRPVVNR